MRSKLTNSVSFSLLRASVAMILTIAPYQIVVGHFGPGFHAANAIAEDGQDSDSGGGGESDSDSSGGDESGDDSDDDGGDDDDDDSGDDADDDAGEDRDDQSDDDDDGDDDDGGDSGDDDGCDDDDAECDEGEIQHFDSVTGIKVEIEVSYPDGTKEEMDDGLQLRKKALEQTIEQRPVTRDDVDRPPLIP